MRKVVLRDDAGETLIHMRAWSSRDFMTPQTKKNNAFSDIFLKFAHFIQ